jgi:hypothetical protein
MWHRLVNSGTPFVDRSAVDDPVHLLTSARSCYWLEPFEALQPARFSVDGISADNNVCWKPYQRGSETTMSVPAKLRPCWVSATSNGN